MKKELIKQRFSKSLNTYQENAVIQAQMAKKLIGLLPDKNYSNILELGCGTGGLTTLAVKELNFETYTAIDIVPECENFISKISPNIKFINADIETLKPEKKYDLIISNAAFQWLNNFEHVIKNLKTNLSENGVILFSTFGDKNFQEISHAGNVSLKYYSQKELETILSDYSIEHFEEDVLHQEFKTIKEMFDHMKKTGVNALNEKPWGLKETRLFKERYKELYKDSVKLTYNPIYVLIKH